ncbi:COUP transcription factor 2-like isoform X3 [Hemicordylus capensis]|uniref:COUP transcription factor 2-like isoform X3 n=1 Tax=Hemicordylus capensis TaxID=884348 RepID=UPI0023043899|nr:COUP transcription factor 2-like isoform X3 [Hemicordylus capensis]
MEGAEGCCSCGPCRRCRRCCPCCPCRGGAPRPDNPAPEPPGSPIAGPSQASGTVRPQAGSRRPLPPPPGSESEPSDSESVPSESSSAASVRVCAVQGTQRQPAGGPGDPQACLVCGERGARRHYGALACEACQAFFARSISRRRVYHCPQNRNCIITRETRNQCRYCRLQKCLRSGMDPSAIRRRR